MIKDGRLLETSPAREVEAINRRLEVLGSAAPRGENAHEAERLRGVREWWQREANQVRDARIRYAWTMFNLHQSLAKTHRDTMRRLEAERWRTLKAKRNGRKAA